MPNSRNPTVYDVARRANVSIATVSRVLNRTGPVREATRQRVLQAAAELNLQIPRDVSLIGFADLDFAATMNPPLTTMRQRPYEIGRLAAKLIVDRIDGVLSADHEPTTVKVTADLIIRNSTDRPNDSR